MRDTREPYNLNRPAHHITNDVLRRIEAICHENGLEVAFGVRVYNAINQLVEQYQETGSEYQELLAAARVIVRVHNLPGMAQDDARAWERLADAIKKVDENG